MIIIFALFIVILLVLIYYDTKTEQLDSTAPVDCVMSDWTKLTPCPTNLPCNTMGKQEQTRTILVQPKNGGKACGQTYNMWACYNPNCNNEWSEMCNIAGYQVWNTYKNSVTSPTGVKYKVPNVCSAVPGRALYSGVNSKVTVPSGETIDYYGADFTGFTSDDMSNWMSHAFWLEDTTSPSDILGKWQPINGDSTVIDINKYDAATGNFSGTAQVPTPVTGKITPNKLSLPYNTFNNFTMSYNTTSGPRTISAPIKHKKLFRTDDGRFYRKM
jgi:hypothetical protein